MSRRDWWVAVLVAANIIVGVLLLNLAFGQGTSISSEPTAVNISETENSVHKFGGNADLDGAEDVWAQGGTYAFASAAESLYVSSTYSGNAVILTVQGLDANWNAAEKSVTLNGESQKSLGSHWIRVNRAFVNDATASQGTTYVYGAGASLTAGVPDANIRAVVFEEHQQTMQAIYSVPAGREAYITKLRGSLNRGNTAADAATCLQVRTFGGVFRFREEISLITTGLSTFEYAYDTPIVVGAKSDIKFSVIDVSGSNLNVSGGFDLILKYE